MNTNQWTPVVVALILAIGTVEAFADSGWQYDEDSDTVVFGHTGGPVAHATALQSDEPVKPAGPWNYHEGSDSIVFNINESRGAYVRKNPSNDDFEVDPYLAFLDQ